MAEADEGRRDLVGGHVGRVRVEGVLGAGGMGHVYRGFDPALERPVALKRLRRDQGMAPLARARFLREARMLSRLDHPNVCRIYDLIEDEQGDFLVLELIEGETLDEALEAGLDAGERLRIAEGIASALAAAHAQHIVHRDLKPQNVMIAGDGQVKVLDFGIARPAADDGEGDGEATGEAALGSPPGETAVAEVPTVVEGRIPHRAYEEETDSGETTRGSVIGTWHFMSPEQARGEAVTEASDVYSLGILLQTLLSDTPPYPPHASLREVQRRVLAGDTQPVTGVDAELAHLLEAMKAAQPSRRPRAEEVRRGLAHVRDRPSRRRSLLRSAAALAAVAAVTALLTVQVSRPDAILEPGQGGRVAVAAFTNLTGDAGNDWVEMGLAAMVAQALDAAEKVDVVGPEEVAAAAGRLQVVPGAELPRQGFEELARALAVEAVVATSVEASGEGYLVRYAVFAVDRGLQRGTVTARDLTAAANRLRAAVGRRLQPAEEWVDLEATFSADAFANRTYAMGLQRLATGDARAAEPYFDVSLDRDPAFLRARLQVGACRERVGEVEEAEAIYEEVLAAARQRDDRRLESECLVNLGRVALGRADNPRARELLAAALAIQEETGDEAGEARTLNDLAVMAYRQRQLDRAEALWRRAVELCQRTGDKRLEAGCRRNLGYVVLRRGNLAGAEENFRRSLTAFEALGDRQGEAFAYGSLGFAAVERGAFQEAREHFEAARAICVDIADARCQLNSLVNLGSAAFNLGRLGEAEEHTRQALELARKLQDRRSEGHSLAALGYFAGMQGQLEGAAELLDAAERVAGEIGDPEVSWLVERNLAYLATRQGRLEEARRHLEAALAHKRDKLTLVAAARYHYERGDHDRAYELQREAKEAQSPGWNAADEARLTTYLRARDTGEHPPLPDEAPGTRGPGPPGDQAGAASRQR